MSLLSNMNCCVPQCSSRKQRNPDLTFHKFPGNINRKNQWRVKLRIGKEVSPRMTVCSKHFQESDFFRHRQGVTLKKRNIKRNAIPSKCLPVPSMDDMTKIQARRNSTQADSDGPSIEYYNDAATMSKKARILSKSNEQHKNASEDFVEIQNEKQKKSKAVDESKSSDDSMSETEVLNKKKRVRKSNPDDDDQHKSSDDSLFDTVVPNENDDLTGEETESGNNFPKIISNSQNGASKLDEMSMHSENSDFESSSLEVQCLRLQEMQDELERRAVPGGRSQHARIEIDDNESSSAMDSLKSTTEVEARQKPSSDLRTTLENFCPGSIFKDNESSSAMDSLKSTTEVEARQKPFSDLQTTLENFCPGSIFKASTPKRPKLSNAKDSSLLPEQTPATQRKYDRENIFGQYVATELKTLRDNPLLYLKTKQSILEIMTKANFDLISSE